MFSVITSALTSASAGASQHSAAASYDTAGHAWKGAWKGAGHAWKGFRHRFGWYDKHYDDDHDDES